MLSIYAQLSSHVLAILREREREAVNMQGTVLPLAKLKIVPTIKNLYHIQCQYVDELSSLVRIKLQHPFPTAINHAGHMWIQFLTFALQLQPFSSP